tara:strand:- start:117 stop:530 length:414 start_codon:yes stop_codon:yes gene_type:complete
MPNVFEEAVLKLKRIARLSLVPGAKYNSETGDIEAPTATQGMFRYFRGDTRDKTLSMIRDTYDYVNDLVCNRMQPGDDCDMLSTAIEQAMAGCEATRRVYESDAQFGDNVEIHQRNFERMLPKLKGKSPRSGSGGKK